MKTLLFMLLALPLLAQAQSDTLRSARREDLKPIGNDLIPTYYGRYGWGARPQYTYDGLDIRPRELGPYILALGDENATREWQKYQTGRSAGVLMIIGGSITTIAGFATMGSNRPDANGNFYVARTYTLSQGVSIVGGNGQTYNTITVQEEDTSRKNAYAGGVLLGMTGSILAGIGVCMQFPGRHVRRAVQYYNRALRQQGVSWRLEPTGVLMGGGLKLAATF